MNNKKRGMLGQKQNKHSILEKILEKCKWYENDLS